MSKKKKRQKKKGKNDLKDFLAHKEEEKKKGKNEALQNNILATAIINLIISVLQLLNLILNK